MDKKLSKATTFKILIIVLSVLLLVSIASTAVFGVKYYKVNRSFNTVSQENSSNKVQLDEKISENEELKEQNSSDKQSYEDKLNSQSKEHESIVDKLNNQIKDLNKKLATKNSTTNADKNDVPVTLPKPTQSAGKTVYLTFDDGPSQYTPQILDTLDKYGVKATFFVKNGGNYNYLMKEIVDRGHQIALHTYCHDYGKIYASDQAFLDDLNKISNLVETQTGVKTMLMRFPGGSSNTVSKKYSKGIMTRMTKQVTNMGYTYFDWNCSNGDADGANNVSAQLNYCSQYPKSASNIIVLMHDTKKVTMESLPKIIEYYQSCGMKFSALTPLTPPAHHSINN